MQQEIGKQEYYPNLMGEMAKVGINKTQLAILLDKNKGVTCQKLSGKTKLTLDECFRIKKLIGSQMPLDELFSNEIVRH